jgi:hypothetical protein
MLAPCGGGAAPAAAPSKEIGAACRGGGRAGTPGRPVRLRDGGTPQLAQRRVIEPLVLEEANGGGQVCIAVVDAAATRQRV